MRLLVVGNFLSASGKGVSYCEALAHRLSTTGHAVLTTSRQPGRAARLIDMVATAARRRHDYDVAQVDVYSGSAFLWAEAVSLVLNRLGKPTILTLHGGALPCFAREHPRRVRRLLAGAFRVTAPSAYLQDALRPYRADIQLLPNAIEVCDYPYVERTRPRPRLVWLRAFHRVYDPETAVRSFRAVAAAFPEARLEMVGPDKGDGTRAAVANLITSLGLVGHVRIRDGVPRSLVPTVLAESDVFLNTSRVDNAPVSLLEAMACGLCVITTDVGGIRHLVSDGEDGVLVVSGDQAALGSAVVTCAFRSGARRAAFSQRAEESLAVRLVRRAPAVGRPVAGGRQGRGPYWSDRGSRRH